MGQNSNSISRLTPQSSTTSALPKSQNTPELDDTQRQDRSNSLVVTRTSTMTSLKRSVGTDPFASNLSSKVYVRSTKSGKVQKIVREVYLRQDIPCSSRLCSACLASAPRSAAGICEPPSSVHLISVAKKLVMTDSLHSEPFCALG